MYTTNGTTLQECANAKSPQKPNVLPVNLENIPAELRSLRRWVLWQMELRGDRGWTKVPYSPFLGGAEERWNPARSDDPKTWGTLSEVVRHLEHFDGIGFMLGDGFAGIDLDKCRDPECGEIGDHEKEIVREINSYTDVSPSATGLKILVMAMKPEGRCRTGHFEMYGERRFFTITGHHLEGTPKSVQHRQEEINRLHSRMFPAPSNGSSPKRQWIEESDETAELPDEITDSEILVRARSAKNGEKFSRLWDGDWEPLGYPSHSEADEALVSQLAFWTGPNPCHIDRLFRRSGLYRDKWDRQDYRERTISRVLDSQVEYFGRQDQELHDLEAEVGQIVQPVEVPKINMRNNEVVRESGKKAKDAFHFQNLASRFLKESGMVLVKYRDKFYAYGGTRYVEENELPDKLRRFLLRNKIPHNNNLVGNVVPIIGSVVFKSSDDHLAMPFFAGQGDFPMQVIVYRNGLLDVEKFFAGDRSLLPHTRNWVSTVCLPYDFDPAAVCPQWVAFLDQVFEGDLTRINLLQEWFGYCLMHDTSQHKLMVLTGVPRAGKGTTIRVLEALVGSDNCAGYNLHSLADKFGLRKLVGKLVAFVGEVNLANSRDKYRILETLNSIVGEDKVDVEEKFKPDGMSQKLPVRFVIACNDLPNFVDPSGALAARLLLLDYAISFEGREDRDLEKKLVAEVSGISNWALAGYVRLRQNGSFTVPTKSKALVDEFRRENSDAYAFLQDCLAVERPLDPGNLGKVRFTDNNVSVSSKKLEDRYVKWCEENNIDVPSMKWLCRNLKTILPKLREERRQQDGVRQRVYYGIGLCD